MSKRTYSLPTGSDTKRAKQTRRNERKERKQADRRTWEQKAADRERDADAPYQHFHREERSA